MSCLNNLRNSSMQYFRRILSKTALRTIAQCYRAQQEARRWTDLDQNMFDFYAQFISPGELFIDVGANMGNRTKVALRLGAKVVAIEPQEACARVLNYCYSGNSLFSLEKVALGDTEREAYIMINEVSTLSTLSKDWISTVEKSGRFQGLAWGATQRVRMTTLDRIIQRHGIPAFVKIDVEGFEYEVLTGLTQPVRLLSLEVVPEFMRSTVKCIDYLNKLGRMRFNYSIGESMDMALPEWVSAGEMLAALEKWSGANSRQFGDLYARVL